MCDLSTSQSMATTTTTKVLIHDLQEPRNSLFSLLQYYLTDFWAEVGDPRVGELPFMGTFALPLAIYFSYFLFVLVLGPNFMRHRRPLSLKWTLVGYNLTMALFNLAVFVKVLLGSNFGRRMLELDWKDRTDRSEHALSAPAAGRGCTCSASTSICSIRSSLCCARRRVKLRVRFLRTSVDLLKLPNSKLSGLHVYHHSTVPTFGWIYFRSNVFHVTAYAFCLLNTPVHTVRRF